MYKLNFKSFKYMNYKLFSNLLRLVTKMRFVLSMLLVSLQAASSGGLGSAGGLYVFLCGIIVVSDTIVIGGFIVGFIYAGIQIAWPSQRQGSVSDYVPLGVALVISSQVKSIVKLFIADDALDAQIDECTLTQFLAIFQS